MNAILTCLLALGAVNANAQSPDILKAPWVTNAVTQLSADAGAPKTGGTAQPQGQGNQGQTEAAKAPVGRDLSHILRERKMALKSVWKERALRKTQKGRRRS